MPMELNEQQQAAKTEYQQRRERTAALTSMTLASTDGTALGPPTPTQEENDLLALGLMHPDDKAVPPQDKGMPSVAAQQAYLASGEALPQAQSRTQPTPAPRPPPAPERSVPRSEPPKP
jgi:hypothetical protein